jgi:hypothetical protein
MEHGDYRIHVVYRAGEAERSGNDFVSLHPLDSGKLLILSGHVWGDRVRAVLLFAVANTFLYNAQTGQRNFDLEKPEVVISHLEERMASTVVSMPEIIVRYAVGILDSGPHTLTYCSEGAITWLLLRGDGTVETDPGVVDVESGEGRILGHVTIEKGDTLVAPSPGLFPGLNMERSGEEFSKVLSTLSGDAGNGEAERALLDTAPDAGADRTALFLQHT